LLAKGKLGTSGNTFDPFTKGKGYLAAVKGYNPTDNPEVHLREILKVAGGLSDPKLARILAYEAPQRFLEMLGFGMQFSPCRLSTCFGDEMVGAVCDQDEIARSFAEQVQARGVKVLEKMAVTALLGPWDTCTGALALQANGQPLAIRAKAVVLATGGLAAMFRYHLSSEELTGDGHMLALRHGARAVNMEFYQMLLGIVGPTRLAFPQWYLAGNPPLRNAAGHEFLADYLPPGVSTASVMVTRSRHGPFSLRAASRYVDIAINNEIREGRGTAPAADPERMAGIYCDFASLSPSLHDELDHREALPALAWMRSQGVDLTAGPVEIACFAHAFNGGLRTDEHGETAVGNLFACGEVAAGPHGADRLGGGMFAATQVFGARAGTAAAERARSIALAPLDRETLGRELDGLQRLATKSAAMSPAQARRRIQMATSKVMLAKDEEGLDACLQELAGIRDGLQEGLAISAPHEWQEAIGVGNLLAMAEIVVRAAQARRESRGPHYRTDYPNEDEAQRGRAIEVSLHDGRVQLAWVAMPQVE
jgi:L-aspartate oxidase